MRYYSASLANRYAVWTPCSTRAPIWLGNTSCILIFPIAGLYWPFLWAAPLAASVFVAGPPPGVALCVPLHYRSSASPDRWAYGGSHYALAAVSGAGIGYANAPDTAWFAAANFVDQIGASSYWKCLVVFLGFIFVKGARWMMTVSWIAIISGIVCMVVLGISAFVGAGDFAANFTSMTGIDYNAIIPAATSAGYPTDFLVFATLAGGATYVGLNTLASTFSANIAGEIRGVQRSQLSSLWGALVQMSFGSYVWFQYVATAAQWSNALLPVRDGDPTVSALPMEPMSTMMIAMLVRNPIVVALLFIPFALTAWGSLSGEAFAPTRNIFAWAFDRMIPPKFAEMGRRTRSPWLVILLTMLTVEAWYAVQIYQGAWMATWILIFGWFRVLILGVAACLPVSLEALF